MRITKLVSIRDTEVDIDLSLEDLSMIVMESDATDRLNWVLYKMNDVFRFFKAIPAETILAMKGKQRELIGQGLRQHSERFSGAIAGVSERTACGEVTRQPGIAERNDETQNRK